MLWQDTPRRRQGFSDIARRRAILLVGGNPTEEHPLLAWTLRTNVRLNRARLYVANSKPIKLERQAKATQELPPGGYKDLAALLDHGQRRNSARPCWLRSRSWSSSARSAAAQAMTDLIAWGLKRGNVRFACLGDHANSRGAADMGLLPDLLPGYVPVTAPASFCRVSRACLRRRARRCRRWLPAPTAANWAHCWSSARIRWPG